MEMQLNPAFLTLQAVIETLQRSGYDLHDLSEKVHASIMDNMKDAGGAAKKADVIAVMRLVGLE